MTSSELACEKESGKEGAGATLLLLASLVVVDLFYSFPCIMCASYRFPRSFTGEFRFRFEKWKWWQSTVRSATDGLPFSIAPNIRDTSNESKWITCEHPSVSGWFFPHLRQYERITIYCFVSSSLPCRNFRNRKCSFYAKSSAEYRRDNTNKSGGKRMRGKKYI